MGGNSLDGTIRPVRTHRSRCSLDGEERPVSSFRSKRPAKCRRSGHRGVRGPRPASLEFLAGREQPRPVLEEPRDRISHTGLGRSSGRGRTIPCGPRSKSPPPVVTTSFSPAPGCGKTLLAVPPSFLPHGGRGHRGRHDPFGGRIPLLGRGSRRPPFRSPHHTSSAVAWWAVGRIHGQGGVPRIEVSCWTSGRVHGRRSAACGPSDVGSPSRGRPVR